MTERVVNFGRNLSFQPLEVYQPDSVADLIEILDRHYGEPIRAIGSLHSWSKAPVTTGVCIDMSRINSVAVSSDRKTVVVGAGCKVKRLLRELSLKGRTLPSVGLIDEQTIAGATATGTHGSGKQALSHFIKTVSIAHYDESGKAKVTEVSNGPELRAARCSLGLLGVVVSLTLECREQYNIEEHALAHESLQSVLAKEKRYPLQQFYLLPWSWRFFGHHRVESDKPRSRFARLYRIYNFVVIDLSLHIVMFVLAKVFRVPWLTRFFFKRILPLTIIRNWKVVDDSYPMLVMEHELFRHIEIEVFVQRSELESTIQYLIDVISVFGNRAPQQQHSLQRKLTSIDRWDELNSLSGSYCHHYPICVRRVLSDATAISMASPGGVAGEDWYAISLISYQWPSDRSGFFDFANFVGTTVSQLFGGRCHWGKFNPLDRTANENLYPGLKEFRKQVLRFDAEGNFANDWLKDVLR